MDDKCKQEGEEEEEEGDRKEESFKTLSRNTLFNRYDRLL